MIFETSYQAHSTTLTESYYEPDRMYSELFGHWEFRNIAMPNLSFSNRAGTLSLSNRQLQVVSLNESSAVAIFVSFSGTSYYIAGSTWFRGQVSPLGVWGCG